MKYVIFQSSYEYCNFMCADISERDDVFLLAPFDFSNYKIGTFLFKVRERLLKGNRKFSAVWFRMFLNKRIEKSYEEMAFCFFDSSFLAKNTCFLKWLKKKFPCSSNVLILYNVVGESKELASYYTNAFDAVYSFDPLDAVNYNWHYFWGLMPTSNKPQSMERKICYDFAFIGGDKGRYEVLKRIYMYLMQEGFRCLFYIVSDREQIDEIDKQIISREPMVFGTVIQTEARCKVLIDYSSVDGGRQGLSLRAIEAFYNGCILLSNNPYIMEIPFYNPETMIYFDKIEDVNLNKIAASEFPHKQAYTIMGAGYLLDMIKEHMC